MVSLHKEILSARDNQYMMHSPSPFISTVQKSITPFPPQLRHPRKLLAAAPTFSSPTETDSAPALAYSGNLRPSPPISRSCRSWGGAAHRNVPGTWAHMGISRIAPLMCAISSLFGGFPAASSYLRWHAHVGPSPCPEPRTGLAKMASRKLMFGMLPGCRNHPSVHMDSRSFSPVISLYYWECKGEFTLSCLLCQ